MFFVLASGVIWALMTFTGMKWPAGSSPAGLTTDAEFMPGDFEQLYPRLVASDHQVDRDKAARLILFYGKLLLTERHKHTGNATIEDIKLVQVFFKEHAQRHPALLTNFAFVLELLKRSLEVDDFATASAITATLESTHPEQLAEALPCLRSSTSSLEERMAACNDPGQVGLLRYQANK